MKRIIQVTLTIMLLMPFCISGYAQTIDPVLLQEMEQHRDNEKIRVFVIKSIGINNCSCTNHADFISVQDT